MNRFLPWLLFTYKYLGKPRWDTGVSPPELYDFVSHHPAGWALDLGCGTGTNAITLARAGWQVTAVDFSEIALSIARKKVSASGVPVELRRGDVTRDLGLARTYDLILDLGCFHSIPSEIRPAYAENINRYLQSTGSLLLYAIIRQRKGDYPGITEDDLGVFAPGLRLDRRVDGSDSVSRRSAWLTFVKN